MNLNDKDCNKCGCVDLWDDGCKPVCVAAGCATNMANFDEVYFKVEGIKYDTIEDANIIAKRFYTRYGKRKDVDVILVVVDNDGAREYDVVNYEAIKPALVECPDTVDMFS